MKLQGELDSQCDDDSELQSDVLLSAVSEKERLVSYNSFVGTVIFLL